jgi:UDP-2-acetamido-2,6-beta-L-arabino-hexul-4-ose reductase
VKVLVTGARGFIGRNLVVGLRRDGVDVATVDADSTAAELRDGVRGAGVVFHLAGVNRPDPVPGLDTDALFMAGNLGALTTLLAAVDEVGTRPAIVLSSSAQAAADNPYGRSKRAAERALRAHARQHGLPAVIYRLPGVFGRWCRPDYNSVVATFCHRIARDLPISVSDPVRVVELVHVDDVVAEFKTVLADPAPTDARLGAVTPTFTISLGVLADRIRAFRAARTSLEVADASDPLTRRLLATYLTYLEPDDLIYTLQQRADNRGVLAELLKSRHFGQMFVSRTRPGVTRGNHYHDLKVEKFCVLEGDAVIRFRSVLGEAVTVHRVSGRDFAVVDIPPGMAHSIENVGTGELITLFWAADVFDPERPDTYASEVLGG